MGARVAQVERMRELSIKERRLAEDHKRIADEARRTPYLPTPRPTAAHGAPPAAAARCGRRLRLS